MDISGCSGFIHLLLASTEQFRFFFNPVQLNFELADLSIKFRLKFLCFFFFCFLFACKNSRQLQYQVLFPSTYLIGMYSILTGQLSNSFILFNSFKSYFSLERSTVPFTELRSLILPPYLNDSDALKSTLTGCPVFGEHYSHWPCLLMWFDIVRQTY